MCALLNRDQDRHIFLVYILTNVNYILLTYSFPWFSVQFPLLSSKNRVILFCNFHYQLS